MGKPGSLLKTVTLQGDLYEWEPAEVKHLSKRRKREKFIATSLGQWIGRFRPIETHPKLLALIPLVAASEEGTAQTYSVVWRTE